MTDAYTADVLTDNRQILMNGFLAGVLSLIARCVEEATAGEGDCSTTDRGLHAIAEAAGEESAEASGAAASGSGRDRDRGEAAKRAQEKGASAPGAPVAAAAAAAAPRSAEASSTTREEQEETRRRDFVESVEYGDC